MLWYKAWLETRLRFLICVTGMTVLCVYRAIRMHTRLTPPVTLAYYHSALHYVATQLALYSVVAINFTSMGGLLREKAVGAASFTLALPFSRTRIAIVRIAVGFTQAMLLIAMPLAVVLAIGAIFGDSEKMLSAEQTLLHFAYMASGGLVYYALAFFASCVVEGEYVAPILSFGAAIAIDSALQDPGVRSWDPLNFMMGGHSYYARTGLLTGPLPGMRIGAYVALSIVLVLVSVRAIQVREF